MILVVFVNLFIWGTFSVGSESISGEVEATCFALTMSLFIMIEQQFHVGQTVVKTIGKPFLVQGIKDAINKKEVA